MPKKTRDKLGMKRSGVSRRSLLASSSALVTYGLISGSAVANNGLETTVRLRGSKQTPLSKKEIEKGRANAIEKYLNDGELSEYGLKRLDNLSGNVDLVGYNLVIGEHGHVSENYVESISSTVLSNDEDAKEDVGLNEKRAADIADEMLSETLDKQSRMKQSQVTSSNTNDFDYDWDDLRHLPGNGVDVSLWSEQPHYGNIKRMHEVRGIPDESDQYAVRAEVKMNSGYNLCNNRDDSDYCRTASAEYRNRNCEIEVDWGSGSNIGAGDVAPQNEIDDGTQVTFGGSITDSSIGANYSISESANTLEETSDTSTGVAAHYVSLRPTTSAGRTIAQFQSYSTGEVEGDCTCGKDIVDVTVSPRWDKPLRPYRSPPYWNRNPDEADDVTDTLATYCGCYPGG